MRGVTDSPLLVARSIRAGYGRKQVVFDVSFSLARGEVVALLGHNGAGKTTFLKAMAGLLPVQSGQVWLDGQEITKSRSANNVKRGLVYLPQEHSVFALFSVYDNLLLGATVIREGAESRRKRLNAVLELFPILGERRSQMAGTLSGGQQRMLSVGIALMAAARVLLLDEPSLGLAPSVAQALMETTKHLVERDGLSVLLVEQNVPLAMEVAQRFCVMRAGQIVVEETREEMLRREHLWELF